MGRNASSSSSLNYKGQESSLLGTSRPASSTSLSQHFLPSKFAPLSNIRKRGAKPEDYTPMAKQGGGREAFAKGAARMPDANDEDYDGVSSGWFGKDGGKSKTTLKWNRFKWTLFVANSLLTCYSLIALVFCLLTWFNVWTHADIVRVENGPELIVSTVAASAGILVSLIGWAGILLNNRMFLAIYTFSLWIVFGLLVTPGYLAYKKRTFSLEGKLNQAWSQKLGGDGRMRIQNVLNCCGYFSPFVEAAVSQTCYSRSVLPGCKNDFLKFERLVLGRWYTAAFGLVPLHLFVMVSGLLCSNHVTYRFGKGMMPKAYRLSENSMAVVMDQYANQLAEQYGQEAASEALARTRSNLQDQPRLGYR